MNVDKEAKTSKNKHLRPETGSRTLKTDNTATADLSANYAVTDAVPPHKNSTDKQNRTHDHTDKSLRQATQADTRDQRCELKGMIEKALEMNCWVPFA